MFIYKDSEEGYVFNPLNWNGGDVLREFIFENANITYGKSKKLKIVGGTTIEYSCSNNDDDYIAYILGTEIFHFELCTLSWYKNRGGTESILLNSKVISLKDYLNILNLLEVPYKLPSKRSILDLFGVGDKILSSEDMPDVFTKKNIIIPSNYDVWLEGYCATGQSCKAQYLGEFVSSTFKDACKLAMSKNDWSEDSYNETKNTYWGCRFFDNEKDARKSFG